MLLHALVRGHLDQLATLEPAAVPAAVSALLAHVEADADAAAVMAAADESGALSDEGRRTLLRAVSQLHPAAGGRAFYAAYDEGSSSSWRSPRSAERRGPGGPGAGD